MVEKEGKILGGRASWVGQWLRIPPNARNAGLIPGPGKYHKPWDNKARGPLLLSLRA